jgi:hypothetical protein
MPFPPRRIVALVVTVGLALTACGGDDDPEIGEPLTQESTPSTTGSTSESTAPTTTTNAGTLIEVKVVDGSAEGGVKRAPVRVNDKVTLRVTSDVSDDVHVHGYDLEFEVGPDKPGELVFDATIPGVFEVELHDADREILKLEVSP